MFCVSTIITDVSFEINKRCFQSACAPVSMVTLPVPNQHCEWCRRFSFATAASDAGIAAMIVVHSLYNRKKITKIRHEYQEKLGE